MQIERPITESLKELAQWQGEVLNELAQTMVALGCCCKKHDGRGTPPMMYREWLLCVISAAAIRARGE